MALKHSTPPTNVNLDVLLTKQKRASYTKTEVAQQQGGYAKLLQDFYLSGRKAVELEVPLSASQGLRQALKRLGIPPTQLLVKTFTNAEGRLSVYLINADLCNPHA